MLSSTKSRVHQRRAIRFHSNEVLEGSTLRSANLVSQKGMGSLISITTVNNHLSRCYERNDNSVFIKSA